MSNLTLKESVLANHPFTSESILDELTRLIEKHNLRWVPEVGDLGPCFIMSHLSEAKGLNKADYSNNWNRPTVNVKDESLTPLAGRHIKLEKDMLNDFKHSYFEMYGEDLGKINSLLVGNWEKAYAYLVQGSTETAKDFQAIGAKAVKQTVEAEIKAVVEPPKLVNKSNITDLNEFKAAKLTESKLSEFEIQELLKSLIANTEIKFRFEVPVTDTFDAGTTHRRFDFVERLPNFIRVYELKARPITEHDIKSTIFDKHYIELAYEKYGKPIELNFVSTHPLRWECHDYINELMGDQSGYIMIGNAPCKIKFTFLQDLVDRFISAAVKENVPGHAYWFSKHLTETKLAEIISKRTMIKLGRFIKESYRVLNLKEAN